MVRPADTPALRTAWAAYVDAHPGGTLFHHPTWACAVQAAFGHTELHCLAQRDGRVVGILPLMELQSLLAGRLLVSLPYATYGGVLADDDDARDALAGAALRLVYERNAQALELRSQTATVPGLEDETRYAHFCRPLPEDPRAIETFLPRKARAAARQAEQREGLTISHELTDLPLVHQLYTRSMRRLGSLNYPLRFFEALVDGFGDSAWVTVVRKGATPVAGLLSFTYRATVFPYFLGVDERVRCTGATNLIYLATMRRGVAQGLRHYDFGRTRKDNRGAFDFKVNQGFEPRTLGYQRYTLPGRTAPNLTPANPHFRLARRVWQRLPLTVTRPLGAWLSAAVPG